MMAVQTVESLNHNTTRRGIEGGGLKRAEGARELGEPCTRGAMVLGEPPCRDGSDGETSDYQRSTPSPRDAEAMAMELNSEVGDKSSCPPSPPTHWGAKALHQDLGFVDCSDSSTSSFRSTSSTSSLPYSSSSLPYSSSSPYSSQLDSHISSSLARLSSLSSRSPSLGKQLQVQLEKLPLSVTRKRSILSSPCSSGGKKRRSQELVLSSSLFNTFRISKPPVAKAEPLNLPSSKERFRRREEEEVISTNKTELLDTAAVPVPAISPTLLSTPLLAPAPAPEAASFVVPRKLRFPCSSSSPSGITCKWHGCYLGFKTHGKLSDHIKLCHVSSLLDSTTSTYSCLWEGCKVYGKPSSSRGWVEKHVPLHGGKFAFPCIVEGCKHRFSSQVMLERHVNNHFSDPGSSEKQSGPRKSTETGDTARKRLKRAGVRLKFRQLPFSARIFDFFDAGAMAGIRHSVSVLEERSLGQGGGTRVQGSSLLLEARVLGSRLQGGGERWLHVRWSPENYLPDEWIPSHNFCASRRVAIPMLPEGGKLLLADSLLPRPSRRKQSRKQRPNNINSDFLTPDEVETIKREQEQEKGQEQEK